ncbi:MAG TPA: DUF2600 family protein [Solirubrobacterales bacterium]
MTSARDAGALLWALAAYQRLLPAVRREQRRWLTPATAIPDPSLRAAAWEALQEKGGNAEATAVFGILAPRPHRATAVRAMTALQTAVDYLDSLGEQASAGDPLADGLLLHRALEEAVSPGSPTSDWYRLHPHREDNGYLLALVRACRQEVSALPGWGAVARLARGAARRCGEGQSQTHAAMSDGGVGLRAWAEALDAPSGYLWWEIAAGASSSVAIHALIAAAADPQTAPHEAELIEAAYFPPIGALTVLLDDMVDLERDRAAGEHNYLGYCSGPEAAADRLALLAERAREEVASAPRRHRHAAILAGVAGFYLASPRAPADYAVPIRRRLLTSLGSSARLALAAVRLRRRD